MLSLEQRLDKIEEVIKKPSFRQNKGLGNEVGYYIFDYPAEQELVVRERIEYIRQKNEEAIDGFRIVVFDLYDIIISIAYMQHYAGNTRLLDFTEDPTVALRFACGKAEISPYECPRKVTIYNTKCIEYHEPQAKRTLQAFMELISSDNQEEIKRIIEKNGEVLKKDYFVEMPKTFPRIEKQNGLFLLMGNFTTGELISGKQDFNRTNKVKHELSPTIGRGCQYEGFVGVLRISPCAVAKIRDELEHTTCYRMDYLMEEN